MQASAPSFTGQTFALAEGAPEERARRSLLDFVPFATPGHWAPTHLPELTGAFQRSLTEPQHVCFSAPPQMGKTEALVHGLIWFAWRKPGTVSAYVTYGAEPAVARSREAREILRRLPWLKADCTTERIRFANRSQIIFTSTDGPLESHAVTGWLVVDDPYKNPAQATSAAERQRVDDWFFGTALGRVHMQTSIMVCHHRWTKHDLIQKLAKMERQELKVTTDEGGSQVVTVEWRYTNYPALINDAPPGAEPRWRSLWPRLKSTAFLLQQRALTLKSVWQAYHQGDPQDDGGKLFAGTWSYAKLPDSGYSTAIGIDCAYGDKKGADWNAIVVLYRCGEQYFVAHVERSHEPSPAFEERLTRVKRRWPSAVIRWYPGPSELGLAQQLALRLGVQIPTATENKKLRAEQCAAAWNERRDILPGKAGQIFVPQDAPWLTDFLEELHDFTGIEDQDLHDDQVDALAAAFNALQVVKSPPLVGIRNAQVGGWANLAR